MWGTALETFHVEAQVLRAWDHCRLRRWHQRPGGFQSGTCPWRAGRIVIEIGGRFRVEQSVTRTWNLTATENCLWLNHQGDLHELAAETADRTLKNYDVKVV
jgi:hypothetical protein